MCWPYHLADESRLLFGLLQRFRHVDPLQRQKPFVARVEFLTVLEDQVHEFLAISQPHNTNHRSSPCFEISFEKGHNSLIVPLTGLPSVERAKCFRRIEVKLVNDFGQLSITLLGHGAAECTRSD